MTNYIEHFRLPIIDLELPDAKNNQIDALINNLRIDDINSDVKFKTALETIKRNILLNPVSFEEPKIIDHYQTEKSYPPSYEYLMGGTRKVFVVSVEYKFSGNPELFSYKPNGYGYGSDLPYIYQPSGNSIVVEVECFDLGNKAQIMKEAQKHMNMTFQFIKSNNAYIEDWNLRIEPTLESKLMTYKTKLENLYGN